MTKSPTHISIYDQALSFDDCNIITDWMETQDHVRGKHGNGNFDPKIKDSYDVFMSFGGVNRPDIEDKVNQLIFDALVEATPKYAKSYPEVNLITRWEICDRYNLQKYKPKGGYHTPHAEVASSVPDQTRRVLAWMIYLNDVYDGGGTYFSNYDITIQARSGRLVIWPAYWTHIHNGIVSNTETKYIATGWYEFIH